MELSAYLTFVIVSAVQSATPGLSTFFIVNNAVTHGWRRALGALSDDLVASAQFLALRLVGAAYIIWLGWTFLRPAPPRPVCAAIETAHGQNGAAFWLHSFGVGISNPKAVLFFAALVPSSCHRRADRPSLPFSFQQL